MTEHPPDCLALREIAAELALDTLDGPARGAAIAHLAGCATCRAHVQELTEAVDQLLALAPDAEPPPGFESKVIARIAHEGRPADARRRPSRLLLAAAALVLALGGLAAGFVLARDTGDDDASELASTAMVAPGGDTVGEVWRYGGTDDATLFVSVPAWADIEGTDGPRYALRLELTDGDTVEVGDFGLGDGSSSWGLTAPVGAASITAVSVVDDTGRVWCTGHFT